MCVQTRLRVAIRVQIRSTWCLVNQHRSRTKVITLGSFITLFSSILRYVCVCVWVSELSMFAIGHWYYTQHTETICTHANVTKSVPKYRKWIPEIPITTKGQFAFRATWIRSFIHSYMVKPMKDVSHWRQSLNKQTKIQKVQYIKQSQTSMNWIEWR